MHPNNVGHEDRWVLGSAGITQYYGDNRGMYNVHMGLGHYHMSM